MEATEEKEIVDEYEGQEVVEEVGPSFHPIMELTSQGIAGSDVTKLSEAGLCTVEAVCVILCDFVGFYIVF